MTLVLQSRLSDTIREVLGGTYSITVAPNIERVPRPSYTIRIEWTCHPARTSALVQRVFQEVEWVKSMPLTAGQMGLVRGSLLRDFDRDREDNRYLLNQISLRYQDGDSANLAAINGLPERIAGRSVAAIQD